MPLALSRSRISPRSPICPRPVACATAPLRRWWPSPTLPILATRRRSPAWLPADSPSPRPQSRLQALTLAARLPAGLTRCSSPEDSPAVGVPPGRPRSLAASKVPDPAMEVFYRSSELLHAGRPPGREPRWREPTTRRSRREEMEAASAHGGVLRIPHLHDGGILALVLYVLDSDWIDPTTGVKTRFLDADLEFRRWREDEHIGLMLSDAVQKSMLHKLYHGRDGLIWNVAKHTIGVDISKLA